MQHRSGMIAFEILRYAVANEQQSFQSKITRRLTRKLGSNVSRVMLPEFSATTFTEKFLKEICLEFAIGPTPFRQHLKKEMLDAAAFLESRWYVNRDWRSRCARIHRPLRPGQR